MNTNQQELAKVIIIPVLSDYVLSPDVLYSDEFTGIYFQTYDEQFGRISFNNLDAIKICRGEDFPYPDDWTEDQEVAWVYKVENSKWLQERFHYEKANYGDSYEFGGNVHEMLTDFSHYVFKFHDQFVEVIARGFWFEKSLESLFKKPLQNGHPFLYLPKNKTEIHEASNIRYKVIYNTQNIAELVENTQFCSQKLLEISTEFNGKFSHPNYTLVLMQRQGNLISVLRSYFGRSEFEKEGIATFDDIKPVLEKELERRADNK